MTLQQPRLSHWESGAPFPSAAMVEATRKRFNPLTASMIAPAKMAARRTMEEISLKDKHEDDWSKELKKCWALLETLADTSPKWTELQDPFVPESAEDVQSDLAGMGAKTAHIAVNRREAEGFSRWSNCSRFARGRASALQVAAFLRDKKDQSKSAPARAL